MKIKVYLNEEKLHEKGQYDGYWVLITNTALSSQEVALHYKGLWQIEAGFRDLKSELETSPIYHYKEERIKAHVFICFLALILKITLKKKIKAIDADVSFNEVPPRILFYNRDSKCSVPSACGASSLVDK